MTRKIDGKAWAHAASQMVNFAAALRKLRDGQAAAGPTELSPVECAAVIYALDVLRDGRSGEVSPVVPHSPHA